MRTWDKSMGSYNGGEVYRIGIPKGGWGGVGSDLSQRRKRKYNVRDEFLSD